MLALVHYDYPNMRIREDYYYLHTRPPQRFYTSVKLYQPGQRRPRCPPPLSLLRVTLYF